MNRLSIGIQSFTDRHLQKLGRIHSAADALQAVKSARRAGFDNFNLDLMHGLPEQTTQQAISDLKQAIALEPSHISWYQLTIEPNTAFFSSPPELPQENILDSIQQQSHHLLADKGYKQYEVSAFSTTGKQSRHNLNYWQFGDYLGIGAGAHGKITLPEKQQIIRTAKTRLPADYLARKDSFLASQKAILQDELPLEFMMNALRLNAGVPTVFFQERTGLSIESISAAWQELHDLALVENLSEKLATTPRGLLFLNSVLERF
ncbi:MAG: radical SAM family heme chaperone HemW [Porticoccaceae bacterium]